jgi:hypothetical protein
MPLGHAASIESASSRDPWWHAVAARSSSRARLSPFAIRSQGPPRGESSTLTPSWGRSPCPPLSKWTCAAWTADPPVASTCAGLASPKEEVPPTGVLIARLTLPSCGLVTGSGGTGAGAPDIATPLGSPAVAVAMAFPRCLSNGIRIGPMTLTNVCLAVSPHVARMARASFGESSRLAVAGSSLRRVGFCPGSPCPQGVTRGLSSFVSRSKGPWPAGSFS